MRAAYWLFVFITVGGSIDARRKRSPVRALKATQQTISSSTTPYQPDSVAVGHTSYLQAPSFLVSPLSDVATGTAQSTIPTEQHTNDRRVGRKKRVRRSKGTVTQTVTNVVSLADSNNQDKQSTMVSHIELSKTSDNTHSRTVPSTSAWIYEARLLDIPLPLNTQPRAMPANALINSPCQAFFGISTLPVSSIINFYLQEMERLGWRCKAQFPVHESLLVFEKPYRLCVISLRPEINSKDVALVIFAGNCYGFVQ